MLVTMLGMEACYDARYGGLLPLSVINLTIINDGALNIKEYQYHNWFDDRF